MDVTPTTFCLILKYGNHLLSYLPQTWLHFDYMEKDMFITLYKSIIRPLLEYGTPVWLPFLMKDIHKIESIQHRATKLIPNISNLSYESRLLELGLPMLE